MLNSIDPNSGFCSKTTIYHSLRPSILLIPESTPMSIADYTFSLLQASPPPPNTAALVDAVTGNLVPYSDVIRLIETLAASLQNLFGLSKGDTAFVLAPNLLQIPILYFSLFTIGVTVSVSNPASSASEISHQLQLSKPIIAFATSGTGTKIPPGIRLGIVIIDSPQFESMMTIKTGELRRVAISQSDTAAILYSSGTTGRIKAVRLSHGNFIFALAGVNASSAPAVTPAVSFCSAPFFHAYGFVYSVRALTMGETTVSMERFDMKVMMRAVEKFRITRLALSPPVVVAIVKADAAFDGYNLSSLNTVSCGGASLQKSLIEKFKRRFPRLNLVQAYGLTETTGRIFSTVGPEESQRIGATGRLMPNCEARIVDPETGNGLPPTKPGELWVRGPLIMKGYVDNEIATAEILDSEGWLRTGDLCYIDGDGFLFFVDRLKELIKYKGYQVPPAELEHVLHTHPAIMEAVVAPYPDEETGQIPMAFVIKQAGSDLNETQVMNFIDKQVAPYKKIRRVMFISSIPKNATGKLLRKELIKLALSNAATSKL